MSNDSNDSYGTSWPVRSPLNWANVNARANEGEPLSIAINEQRKLRATIRGESFDDTEVPLLPREGFAYWVAWLKERVTRHYDAVILVTGDVGTSKSTLALRMAKALQKSWSPATGLCYSAEALLHAYETVAPGDVVVYDEGVKGMMAGDQNTPEQKALIKALTLVREKGCILFVCAPDIWLIAKQIREKRATLWLQVRERGRATVQVRDSRIRYDRDDSLGFQASRRAWTLLYDKVPEKSKLWVEYIAEKHRQLEDFLRETQADLARRAGRGKEAPTERRDADGTFAKAPKAAPAKEPAAAPAPKVPTAGRPPAQSDDALRPIMRGELAQGWSISKMRRVHRISDARLRRILGDALARDPSDVPSLDG